MYSKKTRYSSYLRVYRFEILPVQSIESKYIDIRNYVFGGENSSVHFSFMPRKLKRRL